MNKTISQTPALTLKDVTLTWWPLAASWALMTLEGPVQSAVIARMPDAKINLAAWGGVIFPFTLIVSAPIMMMLSASNVFCADQESYRKLTRYTHVLGFGLTVFHLLIGLTPIYEWIARVLLNAPEAIIQPGRLGLIIITPWSWSIAYRRLQQGVMIRYGHSKAVSTGSLIRLIANFCTLFLGFFLRIFSGIVVGCTAVSVGVITEALFTGLRTRSIVKNEMPINHPEAQLTFQSFTTFYVPLMATSFIMIVVMPIASAAMNRMPNAIASLATWSAISGLIFFLRSPGFAFNEVVVAKLGTPESEPALLRFNWLLIVVASAVALLLLITPLADIWLNTLMALPADMVGLGKQGLWLALLLPMQTALISWYQGALVYHRKTQDVTVSVIVYLIFIILVLGAGILWQQPDGLPVSIVAYEVAGFAQVLWLWQRAKVTKKRGY